MKMLLPVLALLAGCAQQAVTMEVPGLERSASLQVRDLRPEAEKQQETFSIMITSDAYALYRLADTAVAPSATRILQHLAFEKFAATSPEITLRHLVVYRNNQAEFRRAAIMDGIGGGALGYALAGPVTTDRRGVSSALANAKLFESFSAADEYKRALYSAQENPGNGSVVLVYIESEIAGKRVFTRSIGPLPRGQAMAAGTLDSAIRYHLAQYP